MITDKVFADAKFYNKLVGVYFTSENCTICDDLFNRIKALPISQKYYLFKVNANEYLQYTVRLSRGIIPSLSILNTDGKMIAIIESTNIEYIQDKLREIYTQKDNLVGLEYPKPDKVEEVNTADFYDIINFAMSGEPIDFRGIEFLLFYSKVHKEYKKLLDIVTPADPIGKFLLEQKIDSLENIYTNVLCLKTIYNIENVIEELLNRITSEGIVYRSSRKEVKGLLVDESVCGTALLTYYQRTFDEKYFNLAMKIYDWISVNLETSMGFRDYIPEDPITKNEYYEPLANSETAIFLAKLWALTDDNKIKEKAEKAMKIAYTLGKDMRVLSRVAIAYIKLNELIKSKKEIGGDIRVEVVKDNGCSNEEVRYKDKCYPSTENIEFTI